MDLPFERDPRGGEHAAAHFLAQPFESAAVAVPVLIRNCSVSLIPARRRASGRGSRRHRSAPRLSCRGGLRNVEPPVRARTGCDGLARRPDFRHARRDRCRSPASRTQPGAHHHGAMRQVANGDRRTPGRLRTDAACSPLRVTISAQSRHGRDVAAIGAAVHHHRAADLPGMPERNSSPVSPAAAACSATVTSSAAAPAMIAIRFDRDRR